MKRRGFLARLTALLALPVVGKVAATPPTKAVAPPALPLPQSGPVTWVWSRDAWKDADRQFHLRRAAMLAFKEHGYTDIETQITEFDFAYEAMVSVSGINRQGEQIRGCIRFNVRHIYTSAGLMAVCAVVNESLGKLAARMIDYETSPLAGREETEWIVGHSSLR